MLGTLRSLGGFVLRKLNGRMEGFGQYALLGAGLLLLAHVNPDAAGLVGVMGITAVKTDPKGDKKEKPANIRAMEADLKALAKELEAGQIEMSGGKITAERGEELEAKALEMEELQAHIDQYNRIAKITKRSREIDSPTLPDDRDRKHKVIYTTPGHLFVASKEFADFRRGRANTGFSGLVSAGRRLGKKVRLIGEEAVAFETKAFDPATLSDLGEDAIVQVDRDPEIVRFEEPEILTIRDILNVVPTQSDAVKYVRHIATERAAATQTPARGGLKPFLKIVFEATTASVETIAVLSKVTEQDVADAPRLVGVINGEMSLDVRVEEERQLMWGNGNNNLTGLMNDDWGIPEFNRAETGDTTIDVIRKMRTDLRKRRIAPNFVAVDPIDWEEIELAKGTDMRYIWGLITDLRGPRIWSLRVVESDAMTDPDTGERRILEGDGIRGATIYDRSGIELAVGFMDDDFGRNLRTLRCEERIALAVKRSHAFEFAITAEAES